MIRMILTDLDHTLLRQDGSISAFTLETLEKCRAKGIRFAIATARYWIGAEKYIGILRPDYEITTDGALIHANGDCVYSCAFTESETNRIVRAILAAAPRAEITAAAGKTVYWNSNHIAASEKLHKAVYCGYGAEMAVRANKIVAELPEGRIARGIADAMGCGLQAYRGESWYAFLPKEAGKLTAIRALTGISGVPAEAIAAFGDDDNDLEMLQSCGLGVAVANAVPRVLAMADAVTLCNDEDGVARWLAEHCLAEG